MRELHQLRGTGMSQLFLNKTHDVVPFDDASLIERTSQKYDSSLFVVGTDQKKRPDNLVVGRVYDGHVLDMFELGVTNYRSMEAFVQSEHVNADQKPILVFQGEPFENSDRHKRLKNLLIGKLPLTNHNLV